MSTKQEKVDAFARLLDIMDDLRAKCPWDRKQTFQSLSYLTIEETYELVDALRVQDMDDIEEEVGDLLLHMVFYAKLGEEQNAFDIASILHRECDKLVERHPHIYGDVKADTEAQVKQNWEALKLKSGKKSILGGVPKSLPAMIKAYRMQEKTAAVGFDWKHSKDVIDKVKEEIEEFHEAHASGDDDHTKEEFGDLLFALINYGRKLGIDPESALAGCNDKFKSRFEYIEQHAGQPVQELTLDEMESLWQEAKLG